jgi:hypothetical protein
MTMAIYELPKPGSKYGPCEGGCDHADCAETRRQAEGNCPLCGKAVGYAVPVVYLSKDLPETHDVVHADCLAELDDLLLPGYATSVEPTRWEGATKEWDVGVVDDGETPATLRTSDHLRFEGDYGDGFRPVTLRTVLRTLRTLARLRASRAASV